MSGGTVLVTGGAGFIGRHIAARLRQAGRPVRVLDLRVSQARPADGVEAWPGSALDAAAVARALSDVT